MSHTSTGVPSTAQQHPHESPWPGSNWISKMQTTTMRLMSFENLSKYCRAKQSMAWHSKAQHTRKCRRNRKCAVHRQGHWQIHVQTRTLVIKAEEADRKSHLSNATEEHLEQAEEEETRIELTLSNAVGVQMGAKEEGGSYEGNNTSLHIQSVRQCCCLGVCDATKA